MQNSTVRLVHGSTQNKTLTGVLCVIVVVQFVLLVNLGVNPVNLLAESVPEPLEDVLAASPVAKPEDALAASPTPAKAPEAKPKAPTPTPVHDAQGVAKWSSSPGSGKASLPKAPAPKAKAKAPSSWSKPQAPARDPNVTEEELLSPWDRELLEAAWKTSVCEDTPLDVDSIQIHVLSWKRPQSLYVLIEQLKAADYSGWDKDVPLFLHVDGGADPLVIQIAWSTHWPHGPIKTDIRESNVGLREMWLSSMREAANDAGPNTLMIVLEDDMRISSVYFQWLLLMTKAYGRNRQCRHESLMGFSLSPVRLMEMRKPFRRWRAKETFSVATRLNTAYLSTLPSSWGGTFWSDRWLEFDAFVSERMRPEYYNISAEADAKTVKSFQELKLTPEALYIPDARSNWWPASWKRFLVDFMYGCGMFMLYPNLKGENALATTLCLQGKHTMHTDSKGEREDDELAADSRIRAPRRIDWQTKPQIAPLIKGDMQFLENLRLPDISALQMTTLWMEPSTVAEALRTGADFVQGLVANEEFAGMGRAWCSSARTRTPAMAANLALVV